MKVHRDIQGLGFRSFDVTLTIESEEEAKALYAIFNYCPNEDILPEGGAKQVRDAIGGRYGDLDGGQLIARGVHYEEFYRSKRFS